MGSLTGGTSRRCAKTVQRPCKWRIKRKSHEESYDSSWDFGALEGTRIPGPLIKSQMLYRLSYERIFRSKTILPNNITTIDCKKQEQRRKKRKFPRKRPDLRWERLSGAQRPAAAGARCLRLSAAVQRLPSAVLRPKTGVRSIPGGVRSRWAEKAARQCSAVVLFYKER